MPVDRPYGRNRCRDRRRGDHQLHRAGARGHAPSSDSRRPDFGPGQSRRGGVPPHPRRAGPRPSAGGAGRVVRAVLRGPHRVGQRHREHGLDRRRAAPPDRVHPVRRRGQRGGHRDQRRRAALLERRGHHAHAHAGNPRHDAGQRHGADRQELAGLLGRGVRRGQLRHRRIRADHGPNGQAQYWAPTLADACALLLRHYEHTYIVPGESCSAPGTDQRPVRP